MVETPKGLRLHIGLFGKRNAGKSSLINALTNQKISIVSEVAGTTTDPVEKACELAPIGPVVFIDTAGVDDVGALGLARVERTRAVLEWVDIALVVANARDFDECESDLVEHLRKLGTPAVLVINKSDLHPADEAFMTRMRAYGIPVVLTDAETKAGIADLRKAIIDLAANRIPKDRALVGDLVQAGDTVVLVTPIDTGAPKGRLILPQVHKMGDRLPMPHKFAIGMVLCSGAFLVLPLGAKFASDAGIVSVNWLILSYALQSIGELMISGLGLAMVAQLVPQRLMGFIMGSWFLTTAGAAIIAGKIANLMAVPENVTDPLVSLEVYGHVFLQIGIVTAVIAALMLLTAPKLNRMTQDDSADIKARETAAA